MNNGRPEVAILVQCLSSRGWRTFSFVDCASSHPQETRMADAFAKLTEVSSVGLLPHKLWGHLEPGDGSLGLEHKLVLWDRNPKLWHRWRSCSEQLRDFTHRKEVRRGETCRTSIALVRNLSTGVYNAFVRWLRTQPRRPFVVQVLADSGLGQPASILRRLRYKIKPVAFLEEDAIHWYDACFGSGVKSRTTLQNSGHSMALDACGL